ncbi:MAG TPA: hypothetical protein VHM19_02960 [Polyangiales bacterium]|jgi:hypothetical protein|nr:hypothetical protein [Polyangiales bacterium]
MHLPELDLDLAISLTALFISGLTAIVGMWVERDPERPIKLFTALAVLCLLTTVVSMWQAMGQAEEAAKQEENMANVLQKLDTIMQKEGVEVPAINDLVKNELSAASRDNPDLVKKVAQRVADSGGNPADVLGSYLPPDEVKRMARGGSLQVKKEPRETSSSGGGTHTAAAAAPKPPPRRAMTFGNGPAVVRPPEPTVAATPTAVAPPPTAAPPVQPAPAVVPPPAEPVPAPVVAPAPAPVPAAPPPAAAPAAPPPSAAPAAPAPPAVKRKPVVRKPAPRGDTDIYDEADQDIRRTRAK